MSCITEEISNKTIKDICDSYKLSTKQAQLARNICDNINSTDIIESYFELEEQLIDNEQDMSILFDIVTDIDTTIFNQIKNKREEYFLSKNRWDLVGEFSENSNEI